MGEEKQESLNAATRSGAAKPSDFTKVIVDTTVQPKAVAFPTDAKLMHRARERLVRLARKHGVLLRQSYARFGKRALMAYQRYAHAKQFRRANRALRSVRTYLGRVFRDIARKIKGDADLRKIFAEPLSLAFRARFHHPEDQSLPPWRTTCRSPGRTNFSRFRNPPPWVCISGDWYEASGHAARPTEATSHG